MDSFSQRGTAPSGQMRVSQRSTFSRRRLVLAWLWISASCATPPRATDVQPIDVFIVAGQSNAVGFDAPATFLKDSDVDGHSVLWWRVGDPPPDSFDSTSGSEGWQPLRAQPRGEPEPKGERPRQYGNFRDASGGFGPEIGFALEIARQEAAGKPVLQREGPPERAFIKVAFSGTSLALDWDPERADEETSCYRALLDESRRALNALRGGGLGDEEQGRRGREPVLRALLWVQGESDAGEKRARSYEARLEALIRALRRDLAAPDLAAVLSVNDQFGGGNRPGVARIVEAQRAVASRDPLVSFADASEATRANGAHFDAAGTLLLGRQMALEWLMLGRR